MRSGGGSSGPQTAGAYGNSGSQTPQGPTPSTHQFASYLPQNQTASAQLGDPVRQLFSDNVEATPELLKARLAETIAAAQGGPAQKTLGPMDHFAKAKAMGMPVGGGLMGALLAGTDKEPDFDIWASKYGSGRRRMV